MNWRFTNLTSGGQSLSGEPTRPELILRIASIEDNVAAATRRVDCDFFYQQLIGAAIGGAHWWVLRESHQVQMDCELSDRGGRE